MSRQTSLFKWLLAVGFLLSFIIQTGMITIPFAVTLAGFWPSIFAVILAGAYLLLTGFYYLEIMLSCPPGDNLFSFTKRYMSPAGAWFSSTVFTLVNYGYLIYFFYLAAPILTDLLLHMGINVSTESCLLFLAILLGISVAAGLYWCAFLNFILLLLAFAVIFLCFYFGVKSRTDSIGFEWSFLFIMLPTVINSLYYNTLLPTIAPLLDYKPKKIKSAIIAALILGALLFIAWFWLAVNMLGGRTEGLRSLNPQSLTFASLYNTPLIGKWLPILLILNVATNSLVIGSLMIDFLSDLLRIPLEARNGARRLAICAIVFIPPFALNIVPHRFIFLGALYMTEIGPLFLSGLLPTICVWSLRYFYQKNSAPMAPGGKPIVLSIGAFSCFVLYLVGLQLFYQISF